jgi:hypothetical protein
MKESPLAHLTKALSEQNVFVGKARHKYLSKEAERKTFEARLIQESNGKSHAERLINAQATEYWLDFAKALARLEAVYEFEKFKLTILDREYQAQYLELKDNERQLRSGRSA